MMERKFTDDEIVKALECCLAKDIVNDRCDECPNLALGAYCMDRMVKDALDLINRQKAEIEDLDRNLKSAYSKIERLKKGWTADIVLTADAKTEAIKEFANRLKEYCAPSGDFGDPCYVLTVTAKWLDNLVKEMTEKDNGN